jgi:hypothetical protein
MTTQLMMVSMFSRRRTEAGCPVFAHDNMGGDQVFRRRLSVRAATLPPAIPPVCAKCHCGRLASPLRSIDGRH